MPFPIRIQIPFRFRCTNCMCSEFRIPFPISGVFTDRGIAHCLQFDSDGQRWAVANCNLVRSPREFFIGRMVGCEGRRVSVTNPVPYRTTCMSFDQFVYNQVTLFCHERRWLTTHNLGIYCSDFLSQEPSTGLFRFRLLQRTTSDTQRK